MATIGHHMVPIMPRKIVNSILLLTNRVNTHIGSLEYYEEKVKKSKSVKYGLQTKSGKREKDKTK